MNDEEYMSEHKLKNRFLTHLGCSVPHVHGLRVFVYRTGAELQLLRAQICCSDLFHPNNFLSNVNALTPVLIDREN